MKNLVWIILLSLGLPTMGSAQDVEQINSSIVFRYAEKSGYHDSELFLSRANSSPVDATVNCDGHPVLNAWEQSGLRGTYRFEDHDHCMQAIQMMVAANSEGKDIKIVLDRTHMSV